jgi:hypothetical protein
MAAASQGILERATAPGYARGRRGSGAGLGEYARAANAPCVRRRACLRPRQPLCHALRRRIGRPTAGRVPAFSSRAANACRGAGRASSDRTSRARPCWTSDRRSSGSTLRQSSRHRNASLAASQLRVRRVAQDRRERHRRPEVGSRYLTAGICVQRRTARPQRDGRVARTPAPAPPVCGTAYGSSRRGSGRSPQAMTAVSEGIARWTPLDRFARTRLGGAGSAYAKVARQRSVSISSWSPARASEPGPPGLRCCSLFGWRCRPLRRREPASRGCSTCRR